MNFCKVIHSINTAVCQPPCFFHSQRPPTEGQVGSDYPRTAKFPPITSLPYIRSHLWLGNSQKGKFCKTPDFFVWAATTGHIARFSTGAPHYTRGAGKRRSLASELYKKARTNVPEVDIWKQAPQGLQKTPSLGLSGLFIRGLFSRASKASFSGAGWGRTQVNA